MKRSLCIRIAMMPLLAASLLCISTLAWSATATFSVLLDTDNNPATGCPVATSKGTFTGAEQILVTTVTTTSATATVTGVARQICTGGTFGGSIGISGGGWTAGRGNGTAGKAAVETLMPLPALGSSTFVRMAVVSSASTGGADAILVDVTGAPIVLGLAAGSGAPVDVPLLDPLMLLALAVLLACAGYRVLRRAETRMLVVACVLLGASASLVLAATVILDGQVGDWAGVPALGTDNAGNAPANADLLAFYAQRDGAQLYFRIDADIALEPAPPPANLPPVVGAGVDQTITLPAAASLAASATDDGLPTPPGALTLSWTPLSGPGTVTLSAPASANTQASFSAAGVYVLRFTASDSVLSASDDVQVTVNAASASNLPPTVNAGSDQTITLPAGAALAGSATDDGLPSPPATLTYAWSVASGPGSVSFANALAPSTAATFSQSGTYVLRLSASDSLLSGQDDVQVIVNPDPGSGLPPEPATVAPPRSTTGILPFPIAIEFLYKGVPPIQTGVAPGTIVPQRAAVIRGRVLDRALAPMPGADVTILNHPEFGQTRSRLDGRFDLAVNGGGKLIVKVRKAGYFEVQRDVIVPWNDFVYAPDLVLTAPDTAATLIDLTLPTMQIARATPMSDGVGARQATLLFPSGTTAQFRMPDGSLQPAPSRLTVRQTEYTVGAAGPQAMPSELPPTSGYTYYLELTADEELAAGAIGVEFNQPVYFYLENFRNFPTGTHAPVGFYDRQAGTWKGEPDGRVVKVIAVTGGLAELDTDGDGSIDNGVGTGQSGASLGISNTERQSLAAIYSAGQSLWRVATMHFSPGDINWPYGPPPDAVPPDGGNPTNEEQRKLQCACPTCKKQGSIIECGNQTLGEDVSIVGTRMALHYRSDRVPGRKAANVLDIPLSGATVPSSLAAITLEVNVAGQRQLSRFAPATAQRTSHVWDGNDVYGRRVQGAQSVRVRVGFEYPAIYQATPAAYYASWGLASGNPISGNAGNNTATIFRDFDLLVGAWDARGQGLGGWSLSAHHVYDYLGRVLYLGTGERRRDVDGLAPVVKTIAGNGTAGAPVEGPALSSPLIPQGSALVVEPDGGALFTSINSGTRLMRLRPDGTLQRVAGPGAFGAPLFGVPARDAAFGFAHKFARGPDGSIYVTYRGRAVIARIRPADQVIELFAGTLDQTGFTGDGGPATAARLNQPRDIAVGLDGSVYIDDSANNRIRRIGPDGIINTIAGTGATCALPPPEAQCDDGPALQQKIGNSGADNHLTSAPDGTLYATRTSGFGLSTQAELYTIGNDGVLRVIGGKRQSGKFFSVAEGVPALDAPFVPLSSLAVDRNGIVYFAYTHTSSQRVEIRFIDRLGRMRILGGSANGFGGDGGPAPSAKFGALPPSIALTPDNQLVITDAPNFRLRRLESRYPGFTGAADYLIPAQSGGTVHRFDPNGRHLQTLHGLTGAALANFAYDGQGLLTAMTDGDGNILTIQRDASGAPQAIVAPFGQVTQLAIDTNGWLTRITNPANEAVALIHQADGLLTGMTTPKGQSYTFAYEAATGYLLNDADPAGGNQALARTMLAPDATRLSGHDVVNTSALGRTTGYRTERLRTGDRVETAIATDGTQTVTSHRPDGGVSMTDATGGATSAARSPDPRWGMLAPVAAANSIRLPSGGTLTTTAAVAATLADPANVFSLVGLATTVTLNGRSFGTAYSAASREVTQTSPAGRVSRAMLDGLGRVVSTQHAGLAPSTMTYDARGRMVSMTTGSGAQARTTTLTYNAQRYLQSTTDALGRVMAFTYDAAGRPTSQTLPDGRVLTMSYDANGNVASIVPPSRPAHTFTYSDVDLETRYDPPDVTGFAPDASDFSYNVDRQPTSMRRADGRTVTPSYDSAGRVSALAFSRGTLAVSYNATTGQLSTIAAPDGVGHSFAYDGGLLLSHAQTGPIPATVSWTYDNDFRVASQTVNGANTVNFTYDADSLLTQAGALAVSRNAQDGLVTGTAIGSVADAWIFSSHAELMDYQASIAGSPVYRSQLTRDAIGRIIGKVETLNGVTDTYSYSYDLTGHLIGASRNALPIGYVYDDNSNRTSTSGPLGIVAGAVYDAQDRLVQYGSITFAYDNHGDLTTRTQGAATTRYNYDEFGNLMRVVLPGGTQIDYIIDGRNRRIGKKVNGTLVKRWLYDGQLRIVAELDGAGTLTSRYVYAGKFNVPAYIVQGATTYRLITDYLGSPRVLIDTGSGALAGTMNHDEYGRVTQDTLSTLIPFGFAGGHYDSQTTLVRFGARDYDAEVGRWTRRDPSRFAGGLVNLYEYAASSPVQYSDPRGFETVLAGHGSWAIGDGYTVVPEGTTVTFHAPHSFKISDALGQAVERGGDGGTGFTETYRAGDRIPNYVLDPPYRLSITDDPDVVTVKTKTHLSDLLETNTEFHWAACRYTPNRNDVYADNTFDGRGWLEEELAAFGINFKGSWDVGGYNLDRGDGGLYTPWIPVNR